jgi:hypothetical protein
VQDQIYALLKKYWSLFNDKGVYVSVKNYKCVINTGDAPLIAIKKILYWPKKTPIMQNTIAALEKAGQL